MEVKVNLSIVLPGSTMFTQKELDNLEKKEQRDYYDYNTMVVEDKIYNKKGKLVKKQPVRLNFFTRKSKPALQSINLGREAYYSMISVSEVPYFSNAHKWKNMSKIQRLEAHLQRICESLEGLSYSYEVFDD